MKYKIIKIKKSKNKTRLIYVPNDKYKTQLLQTLVVLESILLEKNKENNTNFAFQKGRNCALHAKEHIGYHNTLSMDIEDFFDSITPSMVSNYLDDEIIDECFIDGAPRQGLPTSPAISSIAMISIDNKILNLIAQYDAVIKYTRYADDLIFSCDKKEILFEIEHKIKYLLNVNGFRVNNSKTRYQSASNGNRVITGISVNGHRINATRKTLRKLRAALHQNNMKSAIGLYEWSLCKEPNETFS